MIGAPIVGVVGCGVTGSRVASMAQRLGLRVACFDPSAEARTPRGAVRLDSLADMAAADVVVMCAPQAMTEEVLQLAERGVPVVSTADSPSAARALLDAQPNAPVVLGAAMSPGLSLLLAVHLAARLERVDEVHVATHGTAGPACARRHHDALGAAAYTWYDGRWTEQPGGSGRELLWFPEPIGSHDCYRAATSAPLLLHRLLPSARRISAKVSGTRRDRLTARLPMLTPPHAAGDAGAVRVEVRGAAANGARETLVVGAAGHTGDLAAAMATAAAHHLLTSQPPPGVHVPGGPGLPMAALLAKVAELGVSLHEYTGAVRPVV